MKRSSIPPPDPDLAEVIGAAAARIRASRRTVALTGAGLSVESGIPPFQSGSSGVTGLWERYDPMEYGTIEAFERDPARVWEMLREMGHTVMTARPNAGHAALADLEAAGRLACTITQNVDGLHQKAGSLNVLELHGNWRSMTCMACRKPVASDAVALAKLPPLCACGGVLKPDVTLFGEIIPPRLIDAALDEAHSCDCMLVVGTSATVHPAASIPLSARQRGAFVVRVDIRKEPRDGSLADLWLEGPSGIILPELARRIGVARAS